MNEKKYIYMAALLVYKEIIASIAILVTWKYFKCFWYVLNQTICMLCKMKQLKLQSRVYWDDAEFVSC